MQTENKEKVKRGEIYLHDFGNNAGSIQNGVRPVLVVQCDEGNRASTTTVVAALTSVIKKRYLPSHIILGDKYGLKEPSMVMLEQLKTVNQSELVEYIGFVDSEYLLHKVNCGLKKALGLWVDKPQKHKGDIRCFCPACLQAYNKKQAQEQEKKSLLLIQHHDLPEYNLIYVRGMDAAELTEALICMNDDDKQNIFKYLEKKGAGTEEIDSVVIRDSKEYRLDVWYYTDTNEVINLTAETEWNEKETKLAETIGDEVKEVPDFMSEWIYVNTLDKKS